MADQSGIETFRQAFSDLKGVQPFPWQERLFTALIDGEPPRCLDIPTGLGKTSVIEIWLLAHRFRKENSRPPMRLVYVVNRRTIVDQATTIAERLKKMVQDSAEWKQCLRDGLAASALRGALADNREWMQRPHRPAIIIGTVDMIGSRLLFDAYRAGKWTKAMHAGLLGQDSLIVHDEAHLSQPFQKLLEWICKRQKFDHSPWPIHVMAMSATGSREDDADSAPPFQLDETDRELKSVQDRIHAKKRLKVHACEKSKMAEALAEKAAQHEAEGESANRVIVFVTTPAVAKKVQVALTKKLKDTVDRIELLTGTIRGYERDSLIDRPTLCHLLRSTRPPKTVYLISTSAGEVGADFDADHLICDISPLDSMIQRLGRVNRRGEGNAVIDIFADIKEGGKVSDPDQIRLKSRDWLGNLPAIADDPDSRLNASPSALKELREKNSAAYDAAIFEVPGILTPHDVTLDAWAMTSIQENWSLSQPLDEYLHGIAEYEPPRVSIAWRDEIALFFPARQANQSDAHEADDGIVQFESWMEACSLHPREIVSDKAEDVMDLLIARAKTHPDTMFVRLDRRKIYAERLESYVRDYSSNDKIAQQRFCRSIADQTFILPTEIGGLDKAGMIDGAAESKVPDVADGDERSRVIIRIDEEASLEWKRLGMPAHGERSELKSWTQLRDQISKGEGNRKCRLAIRFKTADRLTGVLLYFKTPFKEGNKNDPVKLLAHLKTTETHAEQIASALVDTAATELVKLAGFWHDLGKDRRKWQASIYNTDPEPLAKSFGKGMNPAGLDGYRHEFGSLIDITQAQKLRKDFDALESDQQDLLLHLITTHHGRGRPFFVDGDFDPDNPAQRKFDELITPAAIAQRYSTLQRKFGHWGLAWYESLLMCADQAASRGDEPEDES